MTKYVIFKCYPISKKHTTNQLYCYADSKNQANTIVNMLYDKISALIIKLRTKYSTYLYRYPHCKMMQYINGLYNLNFIAESISKYSNDLIRTNSWLVTGYPNNYDVALDEVRLNNEANKNSKDILP